LIKKYTNTQIKWSLEFPNGKKNVNDKYFFVNVRLIYLAGKILHGKFTRLTSLKYIFRPFHLHAYIGYQHIVINSAASIE